MLDAVYMRLRESAFFVAKGKLRVSVFNFVSHWAV